MHTCIAHSHAHMHAYLHAHTNAFAHTQTHTYNTTQLATGIDYTNKLILLNINISADNQPSTVSWNCAEEFPTELPATQLYCPASVSWVPLIRRRELTKYCPMATSSVLATMLILSPELMSSLPSWNQAISGVGSPMALQVRSVGSLELTVTVVLSETSTIRGETVWGKEEGNGMVELQCDPWETCCHTLLKNSYSITTMCQYLDNCLIYWAVYWLFYWHVPIVTHRCAMVKTHF